MLVELAGRTPMLPGAGAVTFVDVDSLLRRVYGKKKQGVGFGHAKVGGYKVRLRGLQPADRHDHHPGSGAGDRRDPAAGG